MVARLKLTAITSTRSCRSWHQSCKHKCRTTCQKSVHQIKFNLSSSLSLTRRTHVRMRMTYLDVAQYDPHVPVASSLRQVL